ncbi:uncharacterized protein LOC107271347 [Cephus cinctus]|uniref:Uncharacterized protein LOC107271347 n=1 Tax=Cephus cinctus TaxID=211228 RepID=A0AAJ7W590_CEPCN|nr:uncharacterized protein LOC107271347 [Cephus cinctus]
MPAGSVKPGNVFIHESHVIACTLARCVIESENNSTDKRLTAKLQDVTDKVRLVDVKWTLGHESYREENLMETGKMESSCLFGVEEIIVRRLSRPTDLSSGQCIFCEFLFTYNYL